MKVYLAPNSATKEIAAVCEKLRTVKPGHILMLSDAEMDVWSTVIEIEIPDRVEAEDGTPE